ncbi:glycerate dehydrogenase [Poronia punctata]|nr:glycerate dehydrogenase [Poronia punctata]
MTQTHFVIVALQTFFCPWSEFSLPAPYTCEFRDYASTRPDQVAERIRDADIVIATLSPFTAEILNPEMTPRLKMISVIASGTDNVDLAACRARGIVVGNAPHCNEATVTEHALALYFATRRSLTLTHSLVRSGNWPSQQQHRIMDGARGAPPMTMRDELVGIIGYGSVGRTIEKRARLLGMKCVIAARKGKDAGTGMGILPPPPPVGRASFDTVIRECSVLMICLPRAPETMNLLSGAEFEVMKRHVVVINVSRGGIVDEKAVVRALTDGRIAGYGTDVFAQEPAEPETSVLLAPDTRDLNLVMTPHVAWYGEETLNNYRRTCKENIVEFLMRGRAKYEVVG